jgi:AraC-like DNA-binding protein
MTIGLGAHRAVELLTGRRIDPEPLLRRAGLSGLDLASRELLIPAVAEARLIEASARAASDASFGVSMAEGANPRDAGLLYYLFNAAATLRQALMLLSRYIRIANGGLETAVVFSASGDAILEFDYVGLRRGDLVHAAEYHLGIVVRIFREISGRPISPKGVSFVHHRTFAARDFDRFFGCPVQFGAPSDRLCYSRDTLETGVVYADERLLEILMAYCEREAALRGDPSTSFRVAVENEIQKLLPYGQAKIDAIANAVGVSSRSLARRLAEEGTTFSEVLDEIRRTLSLQYLAAPNLSVDQITAMLSYRDAGSFSHAFRRWTGVSPSQVRGDPAFLAKLLDDEEP